MAKQKVERSTMVRVSDEELDLLNNRAQAVEESPPPTMDLSDEELAAASMFDELDGIDGVKINVYQILSGKRAFCFSVLPSESDLAEIIQRCQDDYGPGEYAIDARNKVGFVKRARISVAKPIRASGPNVAPPPEAATQIAQALAGMLQPILAPLAEMATRQQPDPMVAFRSNLALMKEMREVFSPGSAPPRAEKSLLNSVKELMELRQAMELMGMGEGGGTPWALLLEKFGEPLLELTRSMQQAPAPASAMPRPAMPPPPMPAPPMNATLPGAPIVPMQQSPANVPQPAAVPLNEDDPMYPVLSTVRSNLSLFRKAAEQGADPATYADLVLDATPDNQLPLLVQFCQRPDCLDQLARLDGSVSRHARWWDLLRNAVLDGVDMIPVGQSAEIPTSAAHVPPPVVTPESAIDGPDRWPGGDTPNAESHAAVGANG